MKICAITFSKALAGTRYRILDYLSRFEAAGHEVSWVYNGDLKYRELLSFCGADVVVVQKCFMGWPRARAVRAVARRLIFDWDDAMWNRGGGGKPFGFLTQVKVNNRIRWWMRRADLVTCANNHLGDYSRRYTDKVEVVPMALDLSRWYRRGANRLQGPFVIGWSGSAQSLRYLESRDQVIARFLEGHPGAEFRVMCNRPPKMRAPFQFHEWSAERETEFFDSLNVGLMPLMEEKPFTHGKSPTKALQYMAMEVPVVGNMNVGGPAEIAAEGGCISVRTDEEWLDALERLMNPEVHQRYSRAALANIRKNHDQVAVFEKMVRLWAS